MTDCVEKTFWFFHAIGNVICRFGISCCRGVCFSCICFCCWRCFCFCYRRCRRKSGSDEAPPDESIRKQSPPRKAIISGLNYRSLIDTQDESAAVERLREELRKRTLSQIKKTSEPHVRPTTSVSSPEKSHSSRPIPSNMERKENQRRENPADLEAEQAGKEFQAKYDSLKRDCQEEENENQAKRAKADQQEEWEFQQELERERRKDEENFRRSQEEIDEYERETQRILEINMEQWTACNAALMQCIRLQFCFEDAEHEWSNWLDTVRNAIDGAKNRFKLFHKIIRNMSKSSSSYEKIIKNELNSLHKSTLSTYGKMYEAWTTVKSIAEQQSDRIFLRILEKQFVMVCNKTYNCLSSIDYSMTENQSLDGIIQSFQQLNSNEIPTTGQLRNESVVAKWEDYSVIDEPHHYSKRHETQH